MNRKDARKEELESFMLLYGISLVIYFSLIVISNSENRGVWLLATPLLILINLVAWLYFKSREVLDIRYLFYRLVVCCLTLILMVAALIDIWLTGGGSLWGLVSVLVISFIGPVIGLLARLYEPNANFDACLNRKRFYQGQSKFNPSVFYGKVTSENPVLKRLGMASTVEPSDMKIFSRKVSMYSVMGVLAFGVLRSVGNQGVFESLLLSLGVLFTGYLYFYIYVSDFYFCLKANRMK